MDDQILEHLSGEVDEIITLFCIKHKISPLVLSSIIIARLYHLNNAAGSTDDFKKLMMEIGSGRLGEVEEQVIH
jgi:hypothetical protein